LGGYTDGAGTDGGSVSVEFVRYGCQTETHGSYNCYQNASSETSCVETCGERFGDDCFGCYKAIS